MHLVEFLLAHKHLRDSVKDQAVLAVVSRWQMQEEMDFPQETIRLHYLVVLVAA